jgi:hypothetical protein
MKDKERAAGLNWPLPDKEERMTKRIASLYLAVALILSGTCSYLAEAQATHSHQAMPKPQNLTLEQGALLQVVRDSTERFKDVSVAEAEGYHLAFGCVTGPDAGAMGLHYVNADFVAKTPMTPTGEIDATRPQIVIYEPLPNGKLQLIGADYLVIASMWDQAHPNQGAPQLMGQLFHYFEFPNRFGLPAFYTLHVWAWKDNPNGAFVNWHPNVSCAPFSGQNQ